MDMYLVEGSPVCIQSTHYWPLFERSTLLIYYANEVCRRAQLQLTIEMRSIGINQCPELSGRSYTIETGHTTHHE